MLQSLDLAGANLVIVDVERFDLRFFSKAILVDANNHGFALVDAGLLLSSRAFNRSLGCACIDIGSHSAGLIDFRDQLFSFFNQFRGQRFDVIAATQRIDDVSDATFFLQNQLCVASNTR